MRAPDIEFRMFSGVQVLDSLWSPFHGWGDIVEVDKKKSKPIQIVFHNGVTERYYWNGTTLRSQSCTRLLWDAYRFIHDKAWRLYDRNRTGK